MKTKNLLFSSVLLITALCFFNSCKKDNNNNVDFSSKIYSIISKEQIASLKAKGMVLNAGDTPPDISGVYLVSPYTLLSPYGPSDSWQAGKVINDYKYNFYDQVNDEVKVDYKQLNASDQGTGLGSFISGSGNKFSLFAELAGSDNSGVTYKHVVVISGEVTSEGIKNFQYGFILTQKTGDPYDQDLIAVGSSRIWYDGDYTSELTPYFRQIQTPQSNTSNYSLSGNTKH